MALSRPTRYFPDKSSGGYYAINSRNAINVSVVNNIVANDNSAFKTKESGSYNPTSYISTPFTFSVSGTTPIYGVKITIYNLRNEIVYDPETIILSNVVYPINYKGEDIVIKMYVPELNSVGAPYIDNKINSNYKWTATVSWQSGSTIEKIIGAEAYFESRESLKVSNVIRDGSVIYDFATSYLEIDSVKHSFKANCTPTNIPISNFQWNLYNSEDVLIHSTGKIYSPDIRFDYNGFLPLNYNLELYVESVYGNKINVDIPLYNQNMGSHNSFNYQLEVINLPYESCLHVKWDAQEIMLDGGNVYGDYIAGYELHKQKRGDQFTQHVFTFSGDAFEFYDYMVANGEEYTYYLYPRFARTVGGSEIFAFGPYVTTYRDVIGREQIYHKASFFGWVLLILTPNENQSKGTYRVLKQFTWLANASAGSMGNNANITINNSYGRYPRVQRSKNNYMKIPLQSLIGYFSCENNEYIDTQKMIEDVRSITTLNNTMILKSPKGALMNVVPSSEVSVTVDENSYIMPTNMSAEFVEVGNTNGLSVINKVAEPNWMFTISGIQPMNTYSMNLAGYKLEGRTILSASNVTIE